MDMRNKTKSGLKDKNIDKVYNDKDYPGMTPKHGQTLTVILSTISDIEKRYILLDGYYRRNFGGMTKYSIIDWCAKKGY